MLSDCKKRLSFSCNSRLTMTEFRYFSLDEADQASGIVVVIDVLRAFTTAAYAFSGGAAKIMPVKNVEDAFRLQKQVPNSLIMGEVDGFQPPGFDYGNSPAEIKEANIKGKTIIQRSSAGTQGIINCKRADQILAASFVVARATVNYLRRQDNQIVTFLITGAFPGRDGDEDQACGEYIEALIRNERADPDIFTQRVWKSTVGQSFMSGKNKYLRQEDINLSVNADVFPFYLPIKKSHSSLVMTPELFS